MLEKPVYLLNIKTDTIQSAMDDITKNPEWLKTYVKQHIFIPITDYYNDLNGCLFIGTVSTTSIKYGGMKKGLISASKEYQLLFHSEKNMVYIYDTTNDTIMAEKEI